MNIKELITAISVTPEQHGNIIGSPEGLTQFAVDNISTAALICWKEVDEWVQNRCKEIIPIQFAGLIIELSDPSLHGKEPELLAKMVALKKETPTRRFLDMVQDALDAIKGGKDAG